MKLAQGEYVALENIENLYSSSPFVTQLYVHGDSLQSYVIAVLIPDPVQLAAVASNVWRIPVSDKDLGMLDKAASDAQVREAVLGMLNKQGKVAGLAGFEMIKRVFITNELLTVENGCLTPTLKIKRLVSLLLPSSIWRDNAERVRVAGRTCTTGSRTSWTRCMRLASRMGTASPSSSFDIFFVCCIPVYLVIAWMGMY